MNEISKVKSMIENIIKVTASISSNNSHLSEAKHHLRLAADCMEKFSDRQKKKDLKPNQHESWWGNVMTGTAKMSQSPISAQAYTKTLNQLNNLIDEENETIDNLEKQSEDYKNNNKVLND